MNLESLKKIIREEVKNTIRDEVRDIIIEAVIIASNPNLQTEDQKQVEQKVVPASNPIIEDFKRQNPIEKLMEDTKLSFSSKDAKNFAPAAVHPNIVPNKATAMAHTMGMMGDQPGLDIASLPFLKNAKKILDLSKEKDKQRVGGY